MPYTGYIGKSMIPFVPVSAEKRPFILSQIGLAERFYRLKRFFLVSLRYGKMYLRAQFTSKLSTFKI